MSTGLSSVISGILVSCLVVGSVTLLGTFS